MDENANCAPITQWATTCSFVCAMAEPPLPRHTAHIPPHALPHYKEALQGFTFNSVLLS